MSGLPLDDQRPEFQIHLARTCVAMTRAAGLRDAPAQVALPFCQEIADEAGLGLGLGLKLEEAGHWLLSPEGQSRLANLAPAEPEWLPLLRRLRTEIPGPTAREPFVTKMAELIGVWHDFREQRGGPVVFDAELAFELGLLGEHGDDKPRNAGVAASSSEASSDHAKDWASGAYLSTEQLTPLRPRTIEFMPQGFRDPPNEPPWMVRLEWVTSPDADIARIECYGASAGQAWGFAIELA